MRSRGKILIISVVVFVNLLAFLIAFFRHPGKELSSEDQKVAKTLSTLPLPTSTPAPFELTATEDQLIQALSDKKHFGKETIRATAARRLGELKSRKAVPVLLEMLNDHTWFSSDSIRTSCATSLGQIRDTSAEPALVKAMLSGNVAAAEALGMLGTGTAKEELLAFFESIQDSRSDNNKQMILTLTKLLGKLKIQDAIDPLARAVERQRQNIGLEALESLKKIADIRAVPPLLDIAKRDLPIRSAIIETFNHLLLQKRSFKPLLQDDFSTNENSHSWPLSASDYRNIAIEDGILSLFNSLPEDRLEAFPELNCDTDVLFKFRFKHIKGNPDANFGAIIGKDQEQYIEIQIKQSQKDSSLDLRISEQRNNKSTKLLTANNVPGYSSWNTLTIRSIDTVVSLFLNGRYIDSFRSLDTAGGIGVFITGENHVYFDDIEVEKISGPKILTAEFNKKKTPTPKPVRSSRRSEKRKKKETVSEPTPTFTPSPIKIPDKCALVVEVSVMQSKVTEVVLELDGKELKRIPFSELNETQAPRKNPLNWSGTYSGNFTFKVEPGSHQISAYVIRKGKRSGGTEFSFEAQSNTQKNLFFKSKKRQDEIGIK